MLFPSCVRVGVGATLVVAEGFVSAMPGLKIPARPNNVALALRDSCRDGTHWSGGVEQGRAGARVCMLGGGRGNRRESIPAGGAAGVLWSEAEGILGSQVGWASGYQVKPLVC